MPGCLVQRSLARTCSVAGYIDHVTPWRIQCSLCAGFCRPFSSRPALPLGLLGFSPLMLLSVWRVPVPFPWYGGSWRGCAVVPVVGALFQSRGWLPIVEAPGYFRHPTSILAMQLLKASIVLRWYVSGPKVVVFSIVILNEAKHKVRGFHCETDMQRSKLRTF